MTPDQERWAEASQILRWKGDAAIGYVDERIAALSAANDTPGVERFIAIRGRFGRLLVGTVQ